MEECQKKWVSYEDEKVTEPTTGGGLKGPFVAGPVTNSPCVMGPCGPATGGGGTTVTPQVDPGSEVLDTEGGWDSPAETDWGTGGTVGWVVRESFRQAFDFEEWRAPAEYAVMTYSALGGGMAVGGLLRRAWNWAVAGRGTTTLYRAVSRVEAASIRETGRFSVGPNSLGGKWFAETLGHAKQWGNVLNGRGQSVLLKVKLPKSTADQLMRMERLDGIGPARYGELSQLEQALIRELP